MSSEEMVRVSIETEAEMYPCVAIYESPDSGRHEVPKRLIDALNDAHRALEGAEDAILEAANLRRE